MSRRERELVWLLRIMGTIDLLALAAVVAPRAWIDAAHQWLGQGAFPREPVAGYLARSASLWYAIFGILLWFVSCDVRQYAAIIRLFALILLAHGLVMMGVDCVEGLPTWWLMIEGPSTCCLGLALLLGQRRAAAATSEADALDPLR